MANTFVLININKIEKEEDGTSRTYKLDLEKGRIMGMIDGEEAVQQAIVKAIITPRYRFPIYNSSYGSEIETVLQTKEYTREYASAVIEGFVKDALLPDSRIKECTDFELEFKDDNANINFTAKTIYGPVEVDGGI